MIRRSWFVTLLLVGAMSSSVAVRQRGPRSASEKGGVDETGPYDAVSGWMKPAHPGWILYAVEVFAESADRVFVASAGESPVPTEQSGRGSGAVTIGSGLFNENSPGARPNGLLVVYDRNGNPVEEWSQWYGHFKVPHKVAMDPYDPEKHIWFIDRGTQQIFKFSHDGKQLVMTLGEQGVAGSDHTHFGAPTDIAFLPDGSFFVSDGYTNTRVIKFDKNGKYLKEWGTKGTGPSQFNLVHCIAIDAQRHLYVADRTNSRIQVFDENGTFLDEWGNIRLPFHLSVTEDQSIWMAVGGAQRLLKYDSNGKLLTYWGTVGNLPGQMNNPHSFSVDSDGNLFIANTANHRVDKYIPKPNADPTRLVGQPFHFPSRSRVN
jgi:peptidylamidoglycolate lyase